jgi:hypothetical protein
MQNYVNTEQSGTNKRELAKERERKELYKCMHIDFNRRKLRKKAIIKKNKLTSVCILKMLQSTHSNKHSMFFLYI